jgi:hypothetical protein
MRFVISAIRLPDSWRAQLFLGCCVVALILSRDTSLLTDPRFFCEEGSVYFPYAWSHSVFDTLRFTSQGYYALAHNLCALAAARMVPLESAPLVTTLTGGFFQLIPFVIVLSSPAPVWARPWRKALGCAVMLSARVSDEIWLMSLCVHFHLALAAALLLLEPTPALGRRRGSLAMAVLVLAGLTTPLPCLLTPFFALKWHLERTVWSKRWCVGIGLAATAQAMVVLNYVGAATHRFEPLSLSDFVAILLVKCFVLPTVGLKVGTVLVFHCLMPARQTGQLVYPIMIAVLGCLYLMLFITCRKGLPKAESAMFFGPALLLAAVGIAEAAMGQERWALIEPLRHTRYFYVSSVLLLLAILAASGQRHESATLAHRLALATVVLAIVGGFMDYRILRSRDPTWPSWRQECAAWRAHQKDTLAAHPPEISVLLTRERNRDWF